MFQAIETNFGDPTKQHQIHSHNTIYVDTLLFIINKQHILSKCLYMNGQDARDLWSYENVQPHNTARSWEHCKQLSNNKKEKNNNLHFQLSKTTSQTNTLNEKQGPQLYNSCKFKITGQKPKKKN